MKNATTMILMAILAMGLALVLGGCGGDQEAETPKAADVEQAAEEAVEQAGSAEAEKAVEEIVSKLTPEQQAKVDKVVAVSRAVAAAPLKADEIMAEHGVTTEQYDKMMAEISADPAMSLAYTTQMSKP